jgi:probable HAF family extracellular repeat protein
MRSEIHSRFRGKTLQAWARGFLPRKRGNYIRGIVLLTALLAAAVVVAQETDNTTYKFTTISDPHATAGTAAARINNAGDIVGDYATSTGVTGFLDDGGTFTNITAPGALRTWALGMNNSGEIVGYYRTCGKTCTSAYPYIAFVYKAGKYTIVHSPSTTLPSIVFTEVNDSGTIVGYVFSKSATADVSGPFASSVSVTHEGFIYEGGKFTYLLYPGSPYTAAAGISNSGEVVGNYLNSSGKYRGFSYTDGKFTSISVPEATETYIYGISYTTGEMVGAFENSSGEIQGFLYSDGAFTTIDYPGAKSTAIPGINDHGELCGFFANSKGVDDGFLAEP